ncbi:DUF6612 family protein [Anaerosporobacter sp.]
MKKRLVFLLSLILVFSLIGCSKGNDSKSTDPATIYENASKKTSELKDMDATAKMKMVMTQNEENMDISMDMDIKATDFGTEDMKYLCNYKMSMLGMDLDMSMFYTDGYYYVDSFGQKMKAAMDYSEVLETINGSTMQTNELSKYMKDVKTTKDGDNTVITFQLDGDKMTEYIKDMMTDLGTATEGQSFSGIEGDVETTINKDGYFTAVKMNLTLDMEVEGETAKMNMEMDMTYNNPGQEIEEIEVPDLEGYTEVDSSELTN